MILWFHQSIVLIKGCENMGFWSPDIVLNTMQDKQNTQKHYPVIGYTGVQLTSTGGALKFFAEKQNKELFYFSSSLQLITIDRLPGTPNCIAECVLYGHVNKKFTASHVEQNISYGSTYNTTLQMILLCSMCCAIPLYPNTITGFDTGRNGDDNLRFFCNNCTEDKNSNLHLTDIKHFRKNFPEFDHIKIALSKVAFKPTVLYYGENESTYEDKIVRVDKPDFSQINIKEYNNMLEDHKISDAKDKDVKNKNNTIVHEKDDDSEKVLEQLTTPEEERKIAAQELDNIINFLNNPSYDIIER